MLVELSFSSYPVKMWNHRVVKEVVVQVSYDDSNGTDQHAMNTADVREPIKHCVQVTLNHNKIGVQLEQ